MIFGKININTETLNSRICLQKRLLIVNCKYCGNPIASEMEALGKNENVEKSLWTQETCPACHKSAEYDPEDSTFM